MHVNMKSHMKDVAKKLKELYPDLKDDVSYFSLLMVFLIDYRTLHIFKDLIPMDEYESYGKFCYPLIFPEAMSVI